MKHKLFTLLLAIMAGMTMARAEVYSGTCGAQGDNLTWSLNTEDSVLTISGAGAMQNNSIYSSSPWFENYRALIKTIVMSDSVTTISSYAFYDCTNLTSFSVPNNVISIGDQAFSRCANLLSVNIPDNVTYIGSGAFNECHSLVSVNMPAGITNIASNLFLNCKALPSISLPSSVQSIGDQAFANCSTLVSINIPQGATNIGRAAFAYCINLTSLVIPESVTTIGEIAFIDVENIVYSGTATGAPWGAKSMNGYTEGWLVYSDSGKSRLVACSSGATGDIIIPNTVKNIADQAFSWCSKITSVVIPQDITSIGRMVFYYSTNLQSITIPSSVTNIGEAAFANCNNLASIIIPQNVTNIGDYAFSGCESLTSITIPENVTSIGERAFYECSGFTSITCKAVEPPTLGANVFRDDFHMYNPIYIPLYVPAQSVAVYQAADQWSDFTNILPIEDEAPEEEPEDPAPCLIASGTCGAQGDNLTWELSCDSVLTISGMGKMKNYSGTTAPGYSDYDDVIKSVILEEGVSQIGNSAFYRCGMITNVTIPNSVTSIGQLAFLGCSNLTNVTMSNSLKTIGDYAFSNCSVLTDIVIPSGVTSIGERAFYKCSPTSVSIPNTVTSIGDMAFAFCPLTSMAVEAGNPNYDSRDNCNAIIETATNTLLAGFQNTIIPHSVTSIAEHAFVGCSGLTNIVIPNSVTSIGNIVFTSCPGLESMVVEAGNPIYDSRANCNAIIKTATNTLMAGCQNTIIPNSITSIFKSAFEGCYGLTDVVIPSSVTSIGNSAFSNCTGLTSFTNYALTPQSINNEVFVNSSQHACTLYVPSGSLEAYRTAVGWSRFGKIQPIEEEPAPCLIASGTCGAQGDNLTWELSCDSILTITGNGAMMNWTSNADVPWLANKKSILSVVIEHGITSIASMSFYECAWMRNVTIPHSVVSIGSYAFYNCDDLASITIPASVVSIGWNAFYDCAGFTSIIVESENPIYDSRNNCNAIIETATNTLIAGCQNTIIPNTVTSIAAGAFTNRSGLTSVIIPNSVISIGSNAFSHSTRITTVTMGDNVKSIGNAVFLQCTGLKSVTMPNSVTSIGEYAFSLCYNLTDFTLPDSITSIGRYTFDCCYSLPSVAIPANVTHIGTSAFNGCTGLTSITCAALTPPICANCVFTNVDKSIPLYVPAQSVAAYQAADQWRDFTNILPIEETPEEPTNEYSINYLNKDAGLLDSESVTLNLPEAPEIEGYTFLYWAVVAGRLNEGINIQAVYEYTGSEVTAAPDVYTNPANPAQKLIRNGMVYILTGDKTYTLQGQAVK